MLEPDERWRVIQIAEAATPAGRVLGPPDGAMIEATLELLAGLGPGVVQGWRALLAALDLASLPREGARLSSLPLERRKSALEQLAAAESTSWLVRAVCAPMKMVRADDARLETALGIERPGRLPIASERPRWQERIVDLRSLSADEELEVDVVVVGTGAGGAPLAARLAAQGLAVVMLEEGGHFTREHFSGRPLAMQRTLYRDGGLTFAVGNTVIPVPVGRTVGGTTTINSGTCYRTPSDVLRRWQLEHGLRALGPGSLDPYFERVEELLAIAPSPAAVLGGVARVIARGCDALGYAHGPLARNAPGCDAQGVCCFGCPTDAKRSTNVSYVPLALGHGAMVYHHARVDRVLRDGARAVGVEAFAVDAEDGQHRRLVVRARAVVLACGSLHTPTVLLSNGLGNSSDQVGRNLTIHPCSYALARFDEPIRGWAEVPQGYAVEEFCDLGIRFEGGFLPLSLAAGAFSTIGDAWTRNVEGYDRLASFGFMIREVSRGRVTLGASGKPKIRYRVEDEDVRTIVRAQAVLARIFFAAGAQEVHPGMQVFGALRDLADVERLEREGPERVRAHHVDLTAYHPLGTCRMGADPRRSVISDEHESHDVEGLFVCDGSAVPGPLGVNPQVTIMALSERAAEFVARRVESPRSVARAAVASAAVTNVRPSAALAFDETMAGSCEHVSSGARFVASFTVRVVGEASLATTIAARGGTLTLVGTIDLFGHVTARACRGTLLMRPLQRRANLVYDLAFEGDDGARWSLRGEKHAPLFAPSGMTTLHTEIRRDGELFARGILRFDLRDVPSWLATFRRAAAPVA